MTLLLVVALVRLTWRAYRTHRLLLPLSTLAGTLFFAQVLVGAFQVGRDFPPFLLALHTATSVALLLSLGGLVVASWLLRPSPTDAPPPLDGQRARDFLTLTKPLVTALLLVTTYAGMVVGARAWPSLSLSFWTLLGGFLAAGGSSALNQYIDRDLDTHMQRTAKRPLAARRMTPAEGLAFGLALSVLSFYIFAFFVNPLAAFLSLAGTVYYVVIYSLWLKKATVQNIVIGGGAGAIPPLVGWAAATGRLDVPALFLFAIVFLWTPPHFWALALVRRKDYARAGVPMLPVVRGEAETRRQIFLYTLELVGLTLLMPLVKLAGSVFLISALVLGAWLLHAAWRVLRRDGNRVAWKMYRYSSMYLLFLFMALVIDALV
ncbi:MAG: protoheme IX farnesyltransferase [Anaerolineae bacterium]|nr:MAG: protoheme IX farnesyltransferase [Anaerolineae bacterium]